MPTYESWKYCSFEEEGVRCGSVADAECTSISCAHKDHPRFVCAKHQQIVEMVDKALSRMSRDYRNA